jgi:signal transduction histidine kinase
VKSRSKICVPEERIDSAMARDAAQHVGVPLASLRGWIEMLRERGDPGIAQALLHMERDLDRLERVTSRLERAGTAPRRDTMDVTAAAHGVVRWFADVAPTLAHRVVLRFEAEDGACTVIGDAVQIEWAIESLVQNAFDALAGRGGDVAVRVDRIADGGVRVQVTADAGALFEIVLPG